MLRRFGSVLLVSVLMLALLPLNAMALVSPSAQVSMTLSRQSVAVGEQVTLTVSASGGVDVYGSAVDVIFDPTKLQYMSSTSGDLVTTGVAAENLFTTALNAAVSASSERRTAIALRLGQQSGRTADGTLASFTFKALQVGTTVFGLTEGSVKVQMVDSTGQAFGVTGPSVTLTVANPQVVPPQITSHLSGQTNYSSQSTVVITGTATPGASIAPVVNGVESTTLSTVNNDGTFSLSGQYTDGTYDFQVHDRDHDSYSGTVTVVVDTLRPEIAINTVTPAVSTTVSGTVTDTNFDKAWLQVNPTAAPGAADEITVTGAVFSKAVTLVAGSTNTVRVTARDKAGNQWAADQNVTVPVSTNGFALKLVPSKTAVAVDEQFTVAVTMVNAQNVAGADVQISFPADKLQVVDYDPDSPDVVDIQGGTVFTLPGYNAADNTAGTIRYAAARSTGYTGAQATIATITFRAIASGTAPVNFTTTLAKDPTTAPLPHDRVNTSVDVFTGGTISGTIGLQGRGPGALAGVRVQVVGTTLQATTDANGAFSIVGVPAGTQSLLLRYPNPSGTNPAYVHYLNRAVTGLTVTVGQTTPVSGVEMRAGDANGDNMVELSDLIILAVSYGKSGNVAGSGYDWRADFNGDNVVELSDLILLATNYGTTGASAPAGQ